MLNIPPRSWEAGPLVLEVEPFVKISAFLEMKSLILRFEDAPILNSRSWVARIKAELV